VKSRSPFREAIPLSHIALLLKHCNPLDAVRAEARRAACREARFQLERLSAVNLDLEPPELRMLARSWEKQLRLALLDRRS
jgi:hypothetical protein